MLCRMPTQSPAGLFPACSPEVCCQVDGDYLEGRKKMAHCPQPHPQRTGLSFVMPETQVACLSFSLSHGHSEEQILDWGILYTNRDGLAFLPWDTMMGVARSQPFHGAGQDNRRADSRLHCGFCSVVVLEAVWLHTSSDHLYVARIFINQPLLPSGRERKKIFACFKVNLNVRQVSG